jgi:hypothetical protein
MVLALLWLACGTRAQETAGSPERLLFGVQPVLAAAPVQTPLEQAAPRTALGDASAPSQLLHPRSQLPVSVEQAGAALTAEFHVSQLSGADVTPPSRMDAGLPSASGEQPADAAGHKSLWVVASCLAATLVGAAWAKTRKPTATEGLELTPAVFTVSSEGQGDLNGSSITVRIPVQPPAGVRSDLEVFAQATGAVFEPLDSGEATDFMTSWLEAASAWLREKLSAAGVPRSAPLPDELRLNP